MKHKIICGHVIPALKTLPDEHVDMLMTSVPYWGLRDYGADTATIWGGNKDCEHEWIDSSFKTITAIGMQERILKEKQKDTKLTEKNNILISNSAFCSKCGAWRGQLGFEPTPELYIEHLRMVFAEVKRVLKKTGTCWVNIGDTYGGIGHSDWKINNPDGIPEGGWGGKKDRMVDIPDFKMKKGGTIPKCMCMIPERFAFMMIDLGYILRNKIIWHKPNPMPSSVKDRFNTTYEMLYFFSKSGKYWFDLDAVREEHKGTGGGAGFGANALQQSRNKEAREHPSGKNPGDIIEVPSVRKKSWCANEGHEFTHTRKYAKDADGTDFWVINTQPFPEAHFAVFPEKLCEKPILAGCPAEVCKHCGMARVRITKTTEDINNVPKEGWKRSYRGKVELNGSPQNRSVSELYKESLSKQRETIGWTDCQCEGKDKYEPGIIIDPFAGSGTVGVAAERLGRNSILIDIKKEYCEMAFKRLKPLIEQVKLTGKQSTITRIGF